MQSHPLGLRLVTPAIDGPNSPTNSPIIYPGHALYQLAALAERDRFKRPARAQEIAAGLVPAWPAARGERRKRDHHALTAADIAFTHPLPARPFEVAEALSVELDTARRLIKDGETMQEAGRDFAPYVEAVGTASQPAALTWAQSVKHAPAQATERHAQWVARQKARGLPVATFVATPASDGDTGDS